MNPQSRYLNKYVQFLPRIRIAFLTALNITYVAFLRLMRSILMFRTIGSICEGLTTT